MLRCELIAGVNDAEDPPVPIPNTVVKLSSAENTWWETDREDRSMPAQREPYKLYGSLFLFAVDKARSVRYDSNVAKTERRMKLICAIPAECMSIRRMRPAGALFALDQAGEQRVSFFWGSPRLCKCRGRTGVLSRGYFCIWRWMKCP